MQRENINYVIVGIVVLAALGGLLAALLAITGRTGPTDTYYAQYRNVTGLKAGTPVYYEGYPVGRVNSVVPEPGEKGMRYRIELRITKGWPVAKDSVAAITAAGFLADVVIDIDEGKPGTTLEPGSELKGREGADVMAAVRALTGEAEDLMESEVRPLVRMLYGRLDHITGQLDTDLPDLLNQLQSLLDQLDASAENVNAVFGGDNRGRLDEMIVNLQESAQTLKDFTQGLSGTGDQLKGLVSDNREGVTEAVSDLRESLAILAQRLDAITQHLESASRNLNEFTRAIRRNPSRLIRGTKVPEEEQNSE